ncbi:MAG: glycosyltransferase family 39 protein [Acidobacteriota bacterium]|nr:glycosyltransferase family 39 protein [Acidobacteriota bacterium]
MEKSNKNFWLAVFAVICIIYVLLRFWHSADSCLWFDEIFSVHAAEHDWGSLFWFVAQDLIHPPLFYVLLKIWISAGGENLFWLRLFPVLFSTIALIPFYLFCRQLKLNYSTIALALSFFAANGALIKYAQEIRMYSVLLCLALFSLWLFARFLNLGKSFTALTIVNVLLIYTHYFGWFVILSEVAAIAIFQRIKIRQILTMFAITTASFTPWIFSVWQAGKINANFSQNLGWASKPDLQTVFQFVFDLIEPFYFQQTSLDASSIFLISVPLLFVLIIAFALCLTNRKIEDETDKRNFYLLLLLSFLPVILSFIASWTLPVSIWGTRHLTIVFAPFAILTAFAIEKIQILYLRLAVLALIFWLTGMAFLLQLQRGNQVSILCAWENLATDLRLTETDFAAPVKVYVFEDVAAYTFWFALRDESERFQIVKVNNIEGLAEDAAYFLPRGFDAVQTTDEDGLQGERFFIAFRDSEWNEAKPPLKNLIEKNYKLGAPQIFEAQGLKAFLVEVRK